MIKYSKRHFENLNASRFYAFFMVFLSHTFIAVTPEFKENAILKLFKSFSHIGTLGVDYFFVLSGFLITWIIIEEQTQTKQLNLKKFMARRSLRIWPLYFFMVCIGFAIFYYSKYLGRPIQDLPSIWNFICFVLNFHIINHGTGFMFFLVFLWTISVEEQFYFVWPNLIKFSQIKVIYLSIALILISIVFRYFNLNDERQLYYATFSVIGNFGVGGLIACIAFERQALFLKLEKGNKYLFAFIYLLLLISFLLYPSMEANLWGRLILKLWFAFLFGFIIIEQAFATNKLLCLGKSKRIDYLGQISYGLYCFHGIVITALLLILPSYVQKENYWLVFIIYPLVILLSTMLIAAISYAIYEKTFGKLKQQFRS